MAVTGAIVRVFKRRWDPSLAGRDLPLAWHLAALCFALVLPILTVAGMLAWSDVEADRVRIEHETLRASREVMSVIDHELAGLVATTQVLSLSRFLQTGDLEGFDEQARDVFRLLGINVVLRNRSSQQLINTRLPRGAALPTNVDTESDTIVLETKKPVISNLFLGGVTRKPLFIVNVPVLHDGKVVYFLNLSIEPERVRELVLGMELPAGWTALVADRRGFVIASSSTGEFGQRLPESILRPSKDGEIVSHRQALGDGQTAGLVASSRSRLSGWTAAVVVPAEELIAPWRHLLLGFGGAGAAVMALSVGLAIVFSRRIEEPVGALAAQAALIGLGDPVHKLSTPIREVNALSEALAEASQRRKATEDALRRSEERLRLAQSAGRIGTWDWDAKTGQATCSEVYRSLYGLDANSPGHRTVGEWLAQVHPEDRARAVSLREAGLATGRFENEYRIVRPDGSVRWIVDRGLAIFDAEGRLARVVGANVDVTETREASERVRELQFELLHASRLSAMGQMAASLAHELNQPLGAAANFLGAARLALQSSDADARARAKARIEKAAEQTIRAGSILRRLRDFIGRGETEKHIVKPQQLIEDAVALAMVGVKDPKLRIRFEFDPNEQPIVVDRVQIQQVVFNLVRNALEATQSSDPREIVLSTRRTGAGEVEISIADTGPGLPADPEIVFKPFASSKPRGMGIGLSICRTIVEAHHGRLRAESRPGGGAVFRFVVPAVQELEELSA